MTIGDQPKIWLGAYGLCQHLVAMKQNHIEKQVQLNWEILRGKTRLLQENDEMGFRDYIWLMSSSSIGSCSKLNS